MQTEAVLDYKELVGFRIAGQGCLSRCSRRQLLSDYPILQTMLPLIQSMRNWDSIAFAVELMQLGYSTGQVTKAARIGPNTATKLRVRMKMLGILPDKCNCGREARHGGLCDWRRRFRVNKPSPNKGKRSETTTGVYRDRCKQKWIVAFRVDGKSKRFGQFVDRDKALERSLEVRAMLGSPFSGQEN